MSKPKPGKSYADMQKLEKARADESLSPDQKVKARESRNWRTPKKGIDSNSGVKGTPKGQTIDEQGVHLNTGDFLTGTRNTMRDSGLRDKTDVETTSNRVRQGMKATAQNKDATKLAASEASADTTGLKKAHVDEGKTNKEKAEARAKRNIRELSNPLGSTGKPLKQPAAKADRRNAVQSGMSPGQHGEKVVGHQQRYQAGVHMGAGDFARASEEISKLDQIAKERKVKWAGNPPRGELSFDYYENQANKKRKGQKEMTQYLVEKMPKPNLPEDTKKSELIPGMSFNDLKNLEKTSIKEVGTGIAMAATLAAAAASHQESQVKHAMNQAHALPPTQEIHDQGGIMMEQPDPARPKAEKSVEKAQSLKARLKSIREQMKTSAKAVETQSEGDDHGKL